MWDRSAARRGAQAVQGGVEGMAIARRTQPHDHLWRFPLSAQLRAPTPPPRAFGFYGKEFFSGKQGIGGPSLHPSVCTASRGPTGPSPCAVLGNLGEEGFRRHWSACAIASAPACVE